tara:strand:- start:110 stop:466 length:357 start_codon:yes stop_codon:yes gene_type:complete
MSALKAEAKKLLNKIEARTSNKQSGQQPKPTNKPITKGENMSDKTQTPVYIEKNRNTDVMIGISEYKGKNYLNIRECWLDARNPGQRNPTKKGVSLSIDKLDEVIKGLQALQENLATG